MLVAGADGFTQLIPAANGIQYIAHTKAGTRPGTAGGATFTFTWQAPNISAGPVIFHAAANAANNDLFVSGDRIYTTSTTVGTGLPTVIAVVNSASFAIGPVVAGSSAVLIGTNLASGLFSASTAPLPTSLGGASVAMNGIAARLSVVSTGAIAFQVPWELAGQSQALLTVTTANGTSSPATVSLAPFAPAIFALNGQGTGQGFIARENSSPNSAGNAAVPGETIQLFGVGLGAVTNRPASGSPAHESPASLTTATPVVTIGGLPAEVVFSRLTPISSVFQPTIGGVGSYQVAVRVPLGAPAGDSVPIQMSIGGASSSNVVTMVIQELQPALEIEMTQNIYTLGQMVTASRYRLKNPRAAPAFVELKVWWEDSRLVPTRVVNQGADGSYVLPANFIYDFGPVSIFQVSSSMPPGNYEFSSRVIDPVTGELLSEDLNPFAIR
jgi:uncharacterized protein (TIGR03437 family)